MNFQFKDIVELILGLVWPVIILIILLIYRTEISQFLKGFAQRATKLSVFEFSIELATLSEFQPEKSIEFGDFKI